MDDNELVEKERPEDIIRVEEIIDEGKLDDALKLLIKFEQRKGLTTHNKVSCHVLQCQILFWQGKYKELVKLAEQAYIESEGLENVFLKVDSLLFLIQGLTRLEKFGEIPDLIKQVEELTKIIPQQLTKHYKQREANLSFVKGYFYNRRRSQNDPDLSTKYLKHSLALREELEIKHEISESLSYLAYNLCVFKGDLIRALEYAEKSLAFAEESTKKYYIAYGLYITGFIYKMMGELDKGIKFYEQSVALYKEINIKDRLASALNNLSDGYKMRGELNRALEYIEQAMALNRELGALRALANNHDFLIQILVDKGDLERAQQHLLDFEQLNNQLRSKHINLVYLLNKASILKTSPRARNRAKAEEIFNQILESEDLSYELTIRALSSLCELLLIELRMINDLEVLDEIKPLIARLSEIVENSRSYWALCETYLLQAKLSLLTFDVNKSQRYLTQAHRIAEKFYLTQLMEKIAKQNEELHKKLDLWEKLKQEDAPMADRMELARLDEKVVNIIQKHTVLTAQITEEKVAVSQEKKICLVCRGEVLRFSYICKCGANYCGNCAQALTELENVCWACNAPIDYSRPIKPFKEEVESINDKKKVKSVKDNEQSESIKVKEQTENSQKGNREN